MTFKANEPKTPMLLLFILNVVMFSISFEWIFAFMSVCILVILSTKYFFEIKENELFFYVSMLGLNLVKRSTSYKNIRLIEFKRTNWGQKSVLIRLENGFRWKISRFNPNNFDEKLLCFANNHLIPLKIEKNFR